MIRNTSDHPLRALVLILAAACQAPAPVAPPRAEQAPATASAQVSPPSSPAAPETITADAPRTTVEGATFTAPAGWTITVRGAATLLEAPERGSRVALVDVHAADADAAVALAWAAYPFETPAELDVVTSLERDGWADVKRYVYKTSPGDKRIATATARRSADTWTVSISDLAEAVAEKRSSQLATIYSRLLPKGYQRETFAGKIAHPLDPARLAALTTFVDGARDELGIPGIALGVIQSGEVVFADGFGSRELGKPGKPDAETLFMIASNTKALTTLLLATLVDDHRMTWDTPVTQLVPSFKLGNAATTARVRVKHLVCACTGVPRRDYEGYMNARSPANLMASLATLQPTSQFGELYQYSNELAAAGGYVAAAVVSPGRELGAAYDAAMQARVFAPLGMTSTTFNFARAQRDNHAAPYEPGLDGKPAPALMSFNQCAIADRPAGGAWSNVRDMLKYVAMELARGRLADGRRYIGEAALLARRAPGVAMSKDERYAMGLVVDTTWGIPVIHHGGDLIGYHSDVIWLPEHGVGAVILTNAGGGDVLREVFRRKLLEVLFDGEPRADARLAAMAKAEREERAAARRRLMVPADPADAGKLAAHYHNDALGDVAVVRDRAVTVFDFGEWRSPVASAHHADGSVSFVTIAPGVDIELAVGRAGAKRTLIVSDEQHEYTFTER